MDYILQLFLPWCLLCLVTLIRQTDGAIYTNMWAVHIEGGERKARSIAESNGFRFVNQVCTIPAWRVSVELVYSNNSLVNWKCHNMFNTSSDSSWC